MAFASFSAGCAAPSKAQEALPLTIRVATDGKDYNPLLDALNGPLQSRYPAGIETLQNDLPNNVRLVEGGQADLAIVPVNVAYLAYSRGWADIPRPYSRLRAVAALYAIPLYLIARNGSGIRNWTDVRGKRIAVGAPDSTTQVTVKMALDGLAVPFDRIDAHWINGNAAVEELRAGTVDAVFHRGNDPPSTLPKLLQVPNVAAVPILPREADRIRALHPFLHPVVVGPGTYGNYPAIPTLGVDSLAVCRDDLSERLVYAITRAVFQSLEGTPRLARGFQRVELRRIEATPIPLHPGAARYFRERELFE